MYAQMYTRKPGLKHQMYTRKMKHQMYSKTGFNENLGFNEIPNVYSKTWFQ